METISENMGAHDRWPSAFTRYVVEGLDHTAPFEQEKHQIGSVGRETFVMAVRKAKPLMGVHAMVMPGTSCFVQCGEEDMWFFFYDVEKLLKKGILLEDATAFFDTENGSAFMKSEAFSVVFAPAKSVVFCPWNWVLVPVYWKEQIGRRPTAPWTFITHIPFLDADFAKEIPKASFTAIDNLNKPFLTGEAPKQSMYAARLQAWTDFVNLVTTPVAVE